MKNKFLFGALLIGTASLFTACSDDNDSNPTLLPELEAFALNIPTYANETVDLSTTKELQLSWSQPKYTAGNAPLPVTYEIQVSPTNSFTVSADEAEADEEEKLVADYAAIPRTTTLCTYSLLAKDLDKAIMRVKKWKEAEVPETQTAYIRINAFIMENDKRLNSVQSNSLELAFNPYYIELKDAAPIMWYLVGGNILDGAWKDNPGVSSLPMFVQADYAYDKATGAGEITYLNYFTTDEWKIQPANFDWNYGFMNAEKDAKANGQAIYRNGAKDDNGNIWMDPAGYYLVTVNTEKNTCTIEKKDIEPTVYKQICIAGSFTGDDWPDVDMTPVNTNGENHVWSYIVNVDKDKVEQFKFKIKGSWDTNWGFGSADGEVNTCGKCTAGGKNIGIEGGAEGTTWVIVFNDITGEFSMVAKK